MINLAACSIHHCSKGSVAIPACMNKKLILGFITEEGGITSHVSIMAKSLNIPALVGVAGILDIIQSCDTVFMDADNGDIYINPEPDAAKELEQKLQQSRKIQIRLLENAKKPAITKDGKQLKVYANVGNLNDVEQAARLDVDGIGLFRTEFLYMQSDHFPTENEQFEVYKKAVQILNREIVIRTLDIGGDKKLNYYTFPKEENPFLGCRAIRFCLGHPEIFKTQLRAILRASIFGPLRIMLPMIVSVEEAEKALALLEEAKQELRDRNQQFEENIPVGMMIETPAAVECAEEFAEMMDFFSIGTNDLTQYMLATDRGNKKLVDLYNPYNPAVLRAIARVIEAGHKAGIEVGMCGEFASRPKAVTLLLGLGLDEFSMSASDIPMIKDAICKSDYKKAKEIVPNILQMRHAGEIKKALESSLSKEL
jgi:phosphoenolpyruvate-protein phosphotransferase (PTS system enzyme I)